VVFVPRGGVSALDQPGQPFHDPAADAACFDAITAGLPGSPVELVALRLAAERDLFTAPYVFDPRQAEAMALAGASLLVPHGG
jgi:uncharacterized protein (UPF0261 family)